MSGTQPTSDGASPKEPAPSGELSAFLEGDFAWMNWADEVERLTLDEEGPKEQPEPDAKDETSQSSLPFVDMSKVPSSPPFIAIVLNLPFDTREEDLTGFFDGIRITCVQLVHQNDGNMVGASYVEFRDRDSLISALQRTGKTLNNRTIRVEVSCGPAKDRRSGAGRGRRAYADVGKGGNAFRGRRSSETGSARNDRDGRQSLRRAQMPNDVRAADYPRRTSSVEHSTDLDNRYGSLPRGYVGRLEPHDAGTPSGPPQFAERHYDTFPRGGGAFNAGRRQEVPYFRSVSKPDNRQGPRTMHERVPYGTGEPQFDRRFRGSNAPPGNGYRQRRSSAQSDPERCVGIHPGRAPYDQSRSRGNQGDPGRLERNYGSLNRSSMGQGRRFARQDDGYFQPNFGRNRFANSWRADTERQEPETIPGREGPIEENSGGSADLPREAETTVEEHRAHLPYSSIFGEAKPVDTERRVREIEQQRLALLRQRSPRDASPNADKAVHPCGAYALEPDNPVCEKCDEEDLLASGEIKLLRRPTPRKEETETTAASEVSEAAPALPPERTEEEQAEKPSEETYGPRGGRGRGGLGVRRARGQRGARRGGGIGRGGYLRGYGGRFSRQGSGRPPESLHRADGDTASLWPEPATGHVSSHEAPKSGGHQNDDVQTLDSLVGLGSRTSSISNGRGGYRFEHIIEFRRGGSRSVSTTRVNGPGDCARSEHAAPPINEGHTAGTAMREKAAREAGEAQLAPATSPGAARANKPKESKEGRYPSASPRRGRGKGGSRRNAKSNGRQAFTDRNKFDLLKSFVGDE